jgi:hypothetical protein
VVVRSLDGRECGCEFQRHEGCARAAGGYLMRFGGNLVGDVGHGSDREGYDEVSELGMDESHFEFEEVGWRTLMSRSRSCLRLPLLGHALQVRVVKEELDGDKS